MSFSYDQLEAVLSSHLGSGHTWQINRIETGKFNASYRVTGKPGTFVLRIAPDDDTGQLFYERNMMRQEPPLHALIRQETDIPVPEIVAHDFERSQLPRDYVIMIALPGMPYTDATHLSHHDRNQVLRQVGVHLQKLHQLTGPRYGYDGPHQPMEPQSTWQAAFRLMWQKLLADVHACGAYNAAETRAALDLFEAYAHLFERDVPPTLLHMDIWGQNILVDEAGQVTGLLDLDRALWGDPEIEYAVLDYCGISASSFWDGYQGRRPDSAEGRIRHRFYILYELQKYMPIAVWRQHDQHSAEEYKQTAEMILEGLQRGLNG